MSNLLGPLGQAVGANIGGQFRSSAAPGAAPVPMARPKATGGGVKSGTAQWVGENGRPELFVPSTSGQIVPMHKAGGGSSVTYNIDASNSTDPAATRQAVAEGIRQAQAGVRPIVRDMIRRGEV
jgi:hypothetical protein